MFLFGGTGRLGPAIIARLRESHFVVLFARDPEQVGQANPDRIFPCDLRDPKAAASAVRAALADRSGTEAGSLAIVHLATSGMQSEEHSDLLEEATIAAIGLSSIVQAVVEEGTEWSSVSVVFASSMAIFTMPQAGLGYGLGKVAGEFTCAYLARYPPGENWRFNVVRIGRASRSPRLAKSVVSMVGYLVSDDADGISGQVFTASSPSASI